MSFAARSYAQVQQAAKPEVTDPHEVIGVTLRELARALAALSAASAQSLPPPPEPVRKAMTALYILQSSLDFELGGTVAPALFRVYEYCRLQVLATFRREPADLVTAAEVIADLHETWISIGSEVRP